MASLSEEDRRIKDRFREELGYWDESYDQLLAVDAGFLDAFRAFLAHPWEEGPLDRSSKALITLAINVAPTTLHGPSTEDSIEVAFDEGASFDEVLEVIELVTGLGIHSITSAVPILVEQTGLPEDLSDEEQAELERIRDQFREKRGYWEDGKEPRLRIDPGHFQRYLDLTAYPAEHGTIDPKIRELIYIAIDASCTHTFEEGIAIHIENALDQGATRAEILEALQLATAPGLHSVRDGIPALIAVAKRRERYPGS